MPAAAPAPDAAVFAGRFSLEATRPSTAEIAALADILLPGTPVYFSAVPTITRHEVVAAAISLRKAGLEPVIHVAARRLANAADLQDLLSGLRAEADVRRLLVIGGDLDAPGAFADALAVIQKGRLREAGIEEIGIGAYPEGHPRIPAALLECALDEKIAAAAAQGLRVHIVSQFSFSPERILSWLRQLRAGGIVKPVKIGMAGPTSVPALLRYAKRCGVAASLRGLVSGVASGLIGHVGPDRIIETLSAAGDLGDVAPHYFSFGGALETARYACEVADRRHHADAIRARRRNA
ncbi:MAG TPA: methylenetetrahydrofolate reductase [Pseudolabrys sp.]|nr:methylenetetrahydrofolate reductase [Pseudolabrys sp.]